MARYARVMRKGIELSPPLFTIDEAADLVAELADRGYQADLIIYRGPKPNKPAKQLATEYSTMDVARVGAKGAGPVHLIAHAGEFAICGAGGSRAALNPRRYIHYADPAEPVTCINCKRVIRATIAKVA